MSKRLRRALAVAAAWLSPRNLVSGLRPPPVIVKMGISEWLSRLGIPGFQVDEVQELRPVSKRGGRRKKQRIIEIRDGAKLAGMYQSFKMGDARRSYELYKQLICFDKNQDQAILKKLPAPCYDGLLTGLARLGEVDACEAIVMDMEFAAVERSEASYSALVQAYVAQGKLEKAKRVVESLRLAENIEPRQRTLAPLVGALCTKKRPLEARAFMRSMILEYNMIPTSDLFAQLIVALAQEIQTSFNKKQNVYLLLEELRSTLRELELYTDGVDSEALEAMYQAIEPQKSFLQAKFVELDPITGACPWNLEVTKLQPPHLDAHDRRIFRDRLLDVTAAASNRQSRKLQQFSRWLRENKHKNFSIVVDGPNVAYYNQNYQGGGFDVKQVALVVDEVRRLGHRPLVIMPSKYCEPVIPNHAKQTPSTLQNVSTKKEDEEDEEDDDHDNDDESIQQDFVALSNPIAKKKKFKPSAMQNLSLAELSILRDWSARGMLYIVPRGCHDDSYWMLATVTGSKPPLAITNDKIRDHWQKLLGARAKDRWSSASVVHFEIEFDRPSNRSVAHLDFPPPFARYVHRNIIDLGPTSAATVWHIPDTSMNATRWLAIRVVGDEATPSPSSSLASSSSPSPETPATDEAGRASLSSSSSLSSSEETMTKHDNES